MACNRLPDAYPSLLVHLNNARNGAEQCGEELPLLINTAPLIAADRSALILAQAEHRASRGALPPLYTARRAAVKAAYDFCLTARDVIQFYCGREWNSAWIAAGWENYTLAVPQGMDGLYDLTLALIVYFEAHPEQEVSALRVTRAEAQAMSSALQATDQAVLNAEADALGKRDTRDAALRVARQRLCDLKKELSIRMKCMDPRWLQFGFNKPGAPETPPIPRDVTVMPQAGARLQVKCAPVPRATRYRFYVESPGMEDEPVLVGGSTEPLFITPALEPGTEYLVYVSASDEGAESALSTPVTVRTSEAKAA